MKDRFPEQWKKVEAMQRKTASQLGVAVDRIQHPLFQKKEREAPPRTAEVLYVHADHLGTPQELTDAQGQIVWSADYRAWGRVDKIAHPPRRVTRIVGNTVQHYTEEQADPVTQNLRFQGQYFDAETGLHYNRMRYYDPDCGRFISQDPIGLNGGENLYQYAPNPVVWIDPHGLKWVRGFQGKKPTFERSIHHEKGPGMRGGGAKNTSIAPCLGEQEELYKHAIPDEKGKNWYAVDTNNVVHRFASDPNGKMHWNGDSSQGVTGGVRPISAPPEVQKRIDSGRITKVSRC